MSLRRPFFLLVLAALLPLVLLSALLGAAWIRDQQQVLERDALATVDRVAALIDRELVAQRDILRALADAPIFDEPLDVAKIAEYAERLRDHQPLWRLIVVSDAEGNRLLSLPAQPGAPTNVIEPESHAVAVATLRPVIGGVRRGVRNHPAFPVRVPVIRDGKLICVLTAAIVPEAINRLLQGAGSAPGWIGAVVDGAGNLVGRTVAAAERVGFAASADALRVVRQRESGLYEGHVLEGWAAIFAFQTIPEAGWTVHMAIPREIYMAPLRRSAWVLGLGGSASLLIAALLVVLLWREVRRRRDQEAALEEVRRLEALGLMTGGVAHDFNNLLMIMQGSGEAILRRIDDRDRVRSYAEAVLVAARRGQSLTRQLLAFGRRSPYRPVSFELRDRTAELLMLLQRSTRGDIATRLDIPGGLWPIHADPEALEVALVNLAVNARDAMPSGGSLTIGARNVALGGRADEGTGLEGAFVAVSVTDTGNGIPEEVQRRIFEPFFTTKPPGKGTGLGLSQVFGFAKQSGGGVTVASRPGKGTTFTLYLPRAFDGEALPDEPAAAGTGTGRPLLLVEDNHDVARVIEEMLNASGFLVRRAADAQEAMTCLERQDFEIVLSDVVMEGGLSGLDLAALIEARWPRMPVLLMTGYSEALAQGGASRWPVIAKPFALPEVLAAIEKALATSAEPPATGDGG